ncbi:methyltransferase domain-containing protein [Streptomyces albus]
MPRDDLTPYWNTNVARHRDVLAAVPRGCGDALDVGCGDGLLARKLTAAARRVTGVDSSPEMIPAPAPARIPPPVPDSPSWKAIS